MKQRMLIFFLAISISAMAQKPVNKPQQQTADTTSNFFLIGKLPDFELLFRAIVTPADVTPNQVKAIAEWIDKGIRKISADSTATKK